MDIAGKVFIVTGGASGLGEGTARMLAAKGGTVVIADMQAEKGEAIATEIAGAFVKCDVSNEADGQAVIAKAVSLGKLMGLVNCAGIAPAEKTVGKNGAPYTGQRDRPPFPPCVRFGREGRVQPPEGSLQPPRPSRRGPAGEGPAPAGPSSSSPRQPRPSEAGPRSTAPRPGAGRNRCT